MSYKGLDPVEFNNENLDALVKDTQTTAVLKILRILSQLTGYSDNSVGLRIADPVVVSYGLLLSDVSSNTTGMINDCDFREINHTFFLQASSVTDGATVSIEGTDFMGDWYLLHSVEVKESGNTIILAQGSYFQLRAKVTNYVDGVYSVRSISVLV